MLHTQAHSHDHTPVRKKASQRLRVAWVFTLILCIAEFVGGFVSNSLALLSDAGHMLGDLAALTLTLISIYWASREANTKKTFGYHRAEVLATFINGVLLSYVSLQILFEAAHRLYSPQTVNLHIMFPVAIAGLTVNLIAAFLLHDFHDHMVTKSAFYHVVSDALSSLAVIIAGIILYKTGWTLIDPIISVLIAALIFRSSYLLLREAYDVLMEGSPTGVDLSEVRKAILDVSGVHDVHDLHVWTIGSGFFAASAHVMVQNMEIRESDKLVSAVSTVLHEKFSINHTTIQVAAVQAPAKIQKLS